MKTMCAVISTGSVNGAAESMCLALSTVEARLLNVRVKCGVATTMGAALMFDRWMRETT